MQNETLAASAVKVVSVGTGALVSAANTGVIGAVAGIMAAAYSFVQIVKALPWLTDYFVAVRSGLRDGDWAHWRSIARREEKAHDDAKS
jgi:hypothetical protein